MKRIVLALAALSALTLAVLWAEGVFFRREVRREPESSVPVHPYADLQSSRESIAPPEAEDPPHVETTPIASDITADPPQLLTHFLSESDEITWATELVLVFDRPLHSVTVGIAAFDVDGRQAQGSLWSIRERRMHLRWRATGADGERGAGELTVNGLEWNELRAYVPDGLVAAADASTGDRGFSDRVIEPRSGIVFCLIPSGTAEVGRENTAGAVTQRRSIRIARPYYMARTETTQAQWRAVHGTDHGTRLGDEFPVDSVSWHDAQSFCESIGASLPSNLRWEYACRAGKLTDYTFGDSITHEHAKFLDVEEARSAGLPNPRDGSRAARSRPIRRTRGDSTTCTATSKSGPLRRTPIRPSSTGTRSSRPHPKATCAVCAAAAGPALRIGSGRPASSSSELGCQA